MTTTSTIRRIATSSIVAAIAFGAASFCNADVSTPDVPDGGGSVEAHGELIKAAEAELASRQAYAKALTKEIVALRAAVEALHAKFMFTGDPKLGAQLDAAFMELSTAQQSFNANRNRIAALQRQIEESKEAIEAALVGEE